jgi:hypothetical protein
MNLGAAHSAVYTPPMRVGGVYCVSRALTFCQAQSRHTHSGSSRTRTPVGRPHH